VAAPAEASGFTCPCAGPAPPLYARVAALKAPLRPQGQQLEEMRPMLAARQLLTRVSTPRGCAAERSAAVGAQVARSQGVRVHQDKLKIDDPVKVLKDVEATPLSSEIACLDAVVTLLETDLGPMQDRARAGRWETSTPCAGFRTRTTVAPASLRSHVRAGAKPHARRAG